jgi:hypothetical protein
MLREIADRSCTARQLVQPAHHIGCELSLIDLEVVEQPDQVGVLFLEQLVEPVHQLHIWVATQLAKDGRTFKRPEEQRVEFPKE